MEPDIDTLRAQAEQGNANAQYRLGGLYRDGTGVQQDQTVMVMLGAVLYAVSCVLAYALYVRYRDLYRQIEKPESSEDNDDDDATTDTEPPA